MPHQTVVVPPPRLAIVRWLTSATRPLCAEAGAELRGSMFRRLEAILVSALYSIAIATLAVIHHPTTAFRVWIILDVLVFALRVPLVIAIMLAFRRSARASRLNPWVVDRFVGVGTAWSAVLGFGCFISFCSNDPGLSVLVSLVGVGTAGAQCARNPGTPRLNMLQIGLITVPTTTGACLSAIPLLGWVLLLAPLFLTGMMIITLQLHHDFVAMIVERRESARRALHCALTGLPNRVSFGESLEEAVDALSRSPGSVAVLCLDLDGFKAVNDSFGHPIGDMVLQQVADRLTAMIRGRDVAGRLGGDEFAILLHDGATIAVENVARRLISELSQPYRLGPAITADVGVSVGIAIATARQDRLQGERLMQDADRALYDAKRAGRGVFRRHGAPPPELPRGGVAAGPQAVGDAPQRVGNLARLRR